jgi:hypothetical protein
MLIEDEDIELLLMEPEDTELMDELDDDMADDMDDELLLAANAGAAEATSERLTKSETERRIKKRLGTKTRAIYHSWLLLYRSLISSCTYPLRSACVRCAE